MVVDIVKESIAEPQSEAVDFRHDRVPLVLGLGNKVAMRNASEGQDQFLSLSKWHVSVWQKLKCA